MGKRGRNSSNGRPFLQSNSRNASKFTALAKVQIFEQPTTKSQREDSTDNKDLQSIDTLSILQYNTRKSWNIVMIPLFQNGNILDIDIIAL